MTFSREQATLRARLAERPRRSLQAGSGTAASVLAPLFPGPSGDLHVWLLRKIDTLRRHAGQVALPGGKRDPDDRSPLHTALREAEEEIGLPQGASAYLGAFDDYLTTTGFVVSPHVAWITLPFEPRADPAEVARVFSAPLSTFLSPATPHEVTFFGAVHVVPGYTVLGETVWGATSAILQDLALALQCPVER